MLNDLKWTKYFTNGEEDIPETKILNVQSLSFKLTQVCPSNQPIDTLARLGKG